MKRKLTKMEVGLIVLPAITLCLVFGGVFTRQKVNEVRRQQKPVVTSIAYSPDGGTIVTAERDTNTWKNKMYRGPLFVRLRDAESHVTIKKLQVNCWWIDNTQYSKGGQFIVAVGTDARQNHVAVWDVRNSKKLWTLHPKSGLSLALSPNNKLIAWGSGGVEIRNLHNGALLKTLTHPGFSGAKDMRFSPDGKYLAVSASSKTPLTTKQLDDQIILWDTTSWKVKKIFALKSANTVGFSPDSKTLINVSGVGGWKSVWGNEPDTGLEGGVINGFDVQTGKQKYEIFVEGSAYSLTFSPNNLMFAITQGDNEITVRKTSDGSVLRNFTYNRPNFYANYSLAYSPDGMSLTARDNDTIKSWDVSDLN